MLAETERERWLEEDRPRRPRPTRSFARRRHRNEPRGEALWPEVLRPARSPSRGGGTRGAKLDDGRQLGEIPPGSAREPIERSPLFAVENDLDVAVELALFEPGRAASDEPGDRVLGMERADSKRKLVETGRRYAPRA